ncbi:MAG: tyrosine-type recombinase/integrase [Cyanobacteria bacterium J06635_15]
MRNIAIKERSGSYFIRFKFNKVEHAKTWGRIGDEEALAELNLIVKRIERDIAKDAFRGLDDYFTKSESWDKEKLLEGLSNLAASSYPANALRMHLENYRYQIRCESDARKFIDSLNVSEATKARYATTMKRVAPLLCQNLCYKQKKGSPDPFSMYEIDKILNACDNHHLSQLIQFWLATGLRTGEMAAMNKNWVDFKEGRLKVLGAYSRKRKVFKAAKSGQHRTMPLNTSCLDYLGSLNQEGSYFFFLRDPANFTCRKWKPLLKKADVRYRRPYTLRATCASAKIVVYKGDLARVAYEMGHSIQVLSEHYAGVIHSIKAE